MGFANPFTQNPYPYAFAVTLPATTAPYEIVESFVSGVYTISWSGGGTLTADFYNGSTYIGSATGVSSLTYNLAQSATKCVLWTTVAGISVVLSLTALAVAPVSGVLYTYTASGNVPLVGDAYAVLVGGGGGGGRGGANATPGGGGGSGALVGGRVNLTGVQALVIGTAGTGSAVGAGAAGGATTFAGLTANPGGGGLDSSSGSVANGGSPNGGNGGVTTGNGNATTAPTVSAAISSIFNFFGTGTTGGGGSNTAGAGVGIGTGGSPGVNAAKPAAATGYGAGGGGGWGGGGGGGDGAPGVLYVVLVA